MPTVIGQSEDTFTVMGDDGTVSTVAKSALSPQLTDEISSLGSAIQNEAPILPAPEVPIQPALESTEMQDQVQPYPMQSFTTPGPAVVPQPSRLDRMLEAKDITTDIEAKRAEEGLTQRILADEKIRAYDQEVAERRQESQKGFDELATKIEKASEDLAAAEITDPWTSYSTGQKALAGLSIGLGGFVASLQGRENSALKIINNAIDRDIAIQKAQIQKKGQDVQNLKSLLADNLKIFQNVELSEAVTRKQYLESLARKNDIIASKYQSPEIRANAERTKALLEGEIQKMDLDISEKATGIIDKQMDIAIKQRKLDAGPEPTKAQEMVDSEFAKTYQDFFVKGGFADAKKNLNQLKQVSNLLASGASLTGPIQGLAPDFVRRFTNPDAINARAAVEEVVQRNLREVLGAQFTEKEGERLISRAFDEKVSEEENLKRVDRLVSQMERAMAAKKMAADYYERNGTLRGYTGTLLNDIATAEDFENAQFEKAQNTGAGLTDANISWAEQNINNPDPAKAAKAKTVLDAIEKKRNPAPVRANR